MEIIIKCSDDCRGRKDIYGYIYINHVQEIVRCKDCRHYWKNGDDNSKGAVCLASPKDDAFCSEGERKAESP